MGDILILALWPGAVWKIASVGHDLHIDVNGIPNSPEIFSLFCSGVNLSAAFSKEIATSSV
ncbi:unnamed protein product [Ilex paraguariensis]|uniref:Uncharacterized protein n=1 Tax=Ilex paraguariensis TaxID=185542 RepID=A0ABC8TLP0_9AQUA